jgi:hypothetical protein
VAAWRYELTRKLYQKGKFDLADVAGWLLTWAFSHQEHLDLLRDGIRADDPRMEPVLHHGMLHGHILRGTAPGRWQDQDPTIMYIIFLCVKKEK